MSDLARRDPNQSSPQRGDASPRDGSPPRNISPHMDYIDRAEKISIDSDDDQIDQPVPTRLPVDSQFESEEAGKTDRDRVSPTGQLKYDLPTEDFNGPPVRETNGRPKSPPKPMPVDTLPTILAQQAGDQESPTLKQETELRTLLEDNAMKKSCGEHNQMIVTICTDFSCPKRFWCGICCVKSKDLYVKYSSHMVLISDFLEENIAKLFKVRTFTETDKTALEDRLDNIVKKNEANYDTVWELIEKDVDRYKRELMARIDSSRNSLKDRLNKSLSIMKTFYGDLKTRVRESKTRDLALELQGLREKVEANQMDTLDMIETIGNKVNVDILDIQNLNYNFNKSKSFIDYIHENYDVIRDQTVPTYVSLEKWIEPLVDKVEVLSAPKIKTTLEDPIRDLDTLFVYFEKLIGKQLSAQDRNTMMSNLLKSQETPKDKGAVKEKDAEESLQTGGRKALPDNRRAAGVLDKERKAGAGAGTGVLNSDRPESSHSRAGFSNSRAHLPQPYTHSAGTTPTTLGQPAKPSSYSGLSSALLTNDTVDISDKPSHITSQVFDGSLAPQYIDAEIDTVDRVGQLVLSQETKDFQPILYLHNNLYLISSFMKKDGASLPTFGFKICYVPEDGRVDNGRIAVAYSSDNLFMPQSKICNIAILERESDGLSILCVNTEDGYIYLFSFEIINEGEEFVIELERTIIPKHYEGTLTSMRRLGGTDYLVCTNTKGEILTFDTINAELISTEKHCEGAISTGCFVHENSFYLIGSGNVEGNPNENSLTFLSVLFVKDKKQHGLEYPSFKYKVRVKKAHGDKFGVVAVTADNTKNVPLIFSAGGSDDPCIKVWNFETKELLTTVETKENFSHIFLNLIVFRFSGGAGDTSTGDSRELRNAWKSRAEDLPTYKRMRDEKKRKKTDESSQTYVVICATNRMIRVIKLVLKGKTKAEIRELVAPFETRGRTANTILQTAKASDELYTIFAANSVGKVEMYQLRLTPNS